VLTLNTTNALANGTLAGVISGTGAVTKTGSGTTTLTGANTYSGSTTVSGGTLVMTDPLRYATTSISVASGATLGVHMTSGYANASAANAAAVSANPTSGLAFRFHQTTVSGEGTVRFTAPETGSNYVIIGGKALKGMVFGTSSTEFNGAIDFGSGNWSQGWNNGMLANENNNATLNVAGGASFYGSDANYRVGALTGSGNIGNAYNSSVTWTVGSKNTSTTFGGRIIDNDNYGGVASAPLSLVKVGDKTLTLTGDNAYRGGTTITGGTLQVGNAGTSGKLGAGAVTLSNDSNLKFVRADNTTISNAISGQGNVFADITGTGNLAIDGTIALTGSTTGNTIDLRANGNVTLSKSISTSNSGGDAVKLVAGHAASYDSTTQTWSSLDGNVTVAEGVNITVGDGGVAAIYSGSISGTTGFTSMVPVGSGKFRYNSDEATSNFTKALIQKGSSDTTGVNIIYREAPTLNVKFKDDDKIYDAQAFTGGNGLSVVSGFVKDDTSTTFSDISYSGTSQNGTNAGTYAISGTALNSQGYALSYANGTLTINKKDVTLTGITANNKTYDGTTTAVISAGVISGTVDGETLLISGSGTFDSKNAGTGKTVTADVAALNKANGADGGDWSNYNLTTTGSKTATADIARRPATVSATPTQLTFTGGTLNQAAPTTSNLVAGDDLTINGTASGVATGVYTSALDVSGGDASNYDFTLVNADLTIAAAPVAPVNPVDPVVPVNPIAPFIPNINPAPAANIDAGGARGTATLAPGLDAGFQLASAEQGQCTPDTLSFCECETAKDEDGLNIDGVQLCFEPQRGAELR
jgi:autotransporter-associated beta strand protein